MKTCSRCRKEFEDANTRCPHCGARQSAASGLFQTSTVLIATEKADRVYRSVDEVPEALRSRLLKTTNSANADTILIADRKGREEIDKAISNLPGSAPRRQFGAILSAQQSAVSEGWLTPVRRRWIGVLVLLGGLGVAVLVLLHRWG